MGATLDQVAEGVEAIKGAQGEIKTSMDEIDTASKAYEARLASIEEKLASADVAGFNGKGAKDSKFTHSFSLHDIMKKVSGIGLSKDSNGVGGLSQSRYPKEAREKIMSSEIGADGAFTIPPEFAGELIKRLKAMQVLTQAGMRVRTVDEGFGQLHLPRLTSGITFNEIGELTVPPASTPQVDVLIASQKKVAGVVEVPNDLLKMSGVDLENDLRQDFVEDGALRADLLGLTGTGTAFQPRGVSQTPNIGSVDAGSPNGGAITLDLMIDLQDEVFAANTRARSMAYILHSRVWHQFLKIVENSQHIFPSVFFAPGVAEKPMPRVLGAPVLNFNQLSITDVEGTSSNLSPVFFGDWSELMQVRWGSLEIRVTREATHPTTGRSAFHQDLTVFLVLQRLDYVVTQPGSFALAPDVASS